MTRTPIHELQLEAARWEAVLASARDAVISIDQDGHITLFNKAAEEMFGYQAREVLGEKVNLLMPSPYREEHDGYLENYRRTGIAKAIGKIRNVQAQRKNGEVFPMELSVSEARVGDDVIYSAIIRDVMVQTRQKQVIEELHETQHLILDAAAEGIFGIDLEGRAAFVNPAAAKLLGWEAGDLIGRLKHEVMHHTKPDGTPYPREECPIYAAFNDGAVHHVVDEVFWRKDGTSFPVTYTSSPIRKEGRLFGAVVVFQDESERRRLEQERDAARELSQQKGRLADIGALAATVVHDVGNPLAGLSMSVQTVQRKLARDGTVSAETIGPSIDRIFTTVDRLGGLVGEFKQFLQEQQLELGDVQVPELLRELQVSWLEEAQARGIDLVLASLVDFPTIQADVGKVHRVLDNLIKNALEAIDHGPGEVTLTAHVPNAQKICICIEDTGPGIAKGVDVFALFETTKPLGSGLGLAISKQIMSAHGGGIVLAPLEPHGTSFCLEFPCHGAAAV